MTCRLCWQTNGFHGVVCPNRPSGEPSLATQRRAAATVRNLGWCGRIISGVSVCLKDRGHDDGEHEPFVWPTPNQEREPT